MKASTQWFHSLDCCVFCPCMSRVGRFATRLLQTILQLSRIACDGACMWLQQRAANTALDQREQRSLFTEHVAGLMQRARQGFNELLEEVCFM